MIPEVSLLQYLNHASPLLVVVFTIMWLTRQVLNFFESRREDSKFLELRGEVGLLRSTLDSKEDKVVEGLRKVEAILIQHSASHEGESYRKGERRSMSLQNQKTMTQYQWNWCRDEFIGIITNSIRKNGISGREELVARRVVNSWMVAAKEAKQSLSRLDGMWDYNYAELFDEVAKSLVVIVWQWAIPLYWRESGDLESSLEDLSLRIRSLFEAAYEEFMLQQEDPDTGGVYKRGEVGSTIGETEAISNLADSLRRYREPPSSDYDARVQSPLKRKGAPP